MAETSGICRIPLEYWLETPGPACQAGRSQHQNRDEAWKMLRARLYEAELQRREAAQQALRNGDLATYQKEMNTVGQLLIQIQTMLGTPAPSGQ